MKKIKSTDAQGREIKDVIYNVLFFDCETTGTPG